MTGLDLFDEDTVLKKSLRRQNLLKEDKALILVPSDFSRDLELQSVDLSSLPDRRSIAYCCRCLYIFLINQFIALHVRVLVLMASPLWLDVGPLS